jgi:tubulin monoglycylase TTLL3/8
MEAVNQQFKIDGVTNTWIIKPAGKSRGRGIICTNKINDMLKHMGMSVTGATSHWVAQKYAPQSFHKCKIVTSCTGTSKTPF